ncbi:flagellar biosynthesis protein FliQ [Gilvimarinus agarilyticus]|uniref:flagellar biosynthesis protein FliQ n=1 Tax=Gilvimarinus agarilyticus TaxID=679259 RepID=UPI0005A27B11|nr:flagellar biosynthesis protein FliQ [Gilvimarinus agarilyticus]|tara:strand:- start:1817 stop:2086 length:270 start_codon:yes stop_codon:yes gene_type:complete
MTPEIALSLFADGLYLTILMVLVIVGPSLIVGLVVSMFQAATQINEQTLSFLPRLIVMLITIMIAGHWMVIRLSDLFNRLFNAIPQLIG